MTEKESFYIEQSRRRIFERAGWRCEWPGCLESCTERAHHIANTKSNLISVTIFWNNEFKERRRTKWILDYVINNDKNMAASCTRHNSYFNIGFKPEAVREKLYSIRAALIASGKIKLCEVLYEKSNEESTRTA